MLRLLPAPETGGVDERLSGEFNRLSDALYERIRDFLILHYVANRRHGEPLWDHVRSYPLPESLAHKLACSRRAATCPTSRTASSRATAGSRCCSARA